MGNEVAWSEKRLTCEDQCEHESHCHFKEHKRQRCDQDYLGLLHRNAAIGALNEGGGVNGQ